MTLRTSNFAVETDGRSTQFASSIYSFTNEHGRVDEFENIMPSAFASLLSPLISRTNIQFHFDRWPNEFTSGTRVTPRHRAFVVRTRAKTRTVPARNLVKRNNFGFDDRNDDTIYVQINSCTQTKEFRCDSNTSALSVDDVCQIRVCCHNMYRSIFRLVTSERIALRLPTSAPN